MDLLFDRPTTAEGRTTTSASELRERKRKHIRDAHAASEKFTEPVTANMVYGNTPDLFSSPLDTQIANTGLKGPRYGYVAFACYDMNKLCNTNDLFPPLSGWKYLGR